MNHTEGASSMRLRIIAALVVSLSVFGCSPLPLDQVPDPAGSPTTGAGGGASGVGGSPGGATALDMTTSALLGDWLETGTGTVKMAQSYTCAGQPWRLIVAFRQHNDAGTWKDNLVGGDTMPSDYDEPGANVLYLASPVSPTTMTPYSYPGGGGYNLNYSTVGVLAIAHLAGGPKQTSAFVDLIPYDWQVFTEAPPYAPNGHLQLGMTVRSYGLGNGIGLNGCLGAGNRLALLDIR
jgi:hypothetical protein